MHCICHRYNKTSRHRVRPSRSTTKTQQSTPPVNSTPVYAHRPKSRPPSVPFYCRVEIASAAITDTPCDTHHHLLPKAPADQQPPHAPTRKARHHAPKLRDPAHLEPDSLVPPTPPPPSICPDPAKEDLPDAALAVVPLLMTLLDPKPARHASKKRNAQVHGNYQRRGRGAWERASGPSF